VEWTLQETDIAQDFADAGQFRIAARDTAAQGQQYHRQIRPFTLLGYKTFQQRKIDVLQSLVGDDRRPGPEAQLMCQVGHVATYVDRHAELPLAQQRGNEAAIASGWRKHQDAGRR